MAQAGERAAAVPVDAFKEGLVEADGFNIRYMEAGQGEPLVCLHGAGGLRVSSSHGLLAAEYRVILFEVPGFGTSPTNERTASIPDLADTMARAAANLGFERFNLLGNSFGGRLALWVAVRHPEQVQSLVLAAPAAILPEGPRVRNPEGDPASLYAHPERQPTRPPLDPAIVEKQEALLRRLARPPRDVELEEQLPGLNLPVLVLFGTMDQRIPPEMGRIYRELLPNCHFILVYDAGHALDADRPEAFASVVVDFLHRGPGFVVNQQSALLYP